MQVVIHLVWVVVIMNEEILILKELLEKENIPPFPAKMVCWFYESEVNK